MTRFPIVLAGAAGLAALVAACGSSSTSSTAASSSTTASSTATAAAGGQVDAAYAAKATQICTAGLAQAAQIPMPGDPTKATVADLPKWAAFLDQAAPIQANVVAQLQALGAPAQGQASLAAAAVAGATIQTDLKALQTAAHAGNLTDFEVGLLTYAQAVSNGNSAFVTAGIPGCQTPLPGQAITTTTTSS